ncbi:MAG: hypothetical protein M1818_006972 [Claussenomyces sp. TS43310]|nr:MAG: hypothetical protein M1818_006972 [Claussenomyces sp. TS43310]
MELRMNEMSYLSDLKEQKHQVWAPEIASFFSNPWFERAWIYQEVVCSKSATVYSGLCDASESIARNSLPWNCLTRFYKIAEELEALENRPTSICSVIGSLIFGQTHYDANNRIGNLTDLLTLLELRRDSKVTDARDKIFSLVELSNEGQQSRVLADYSKSVVEVYTSTARSIINSRKDLRILSAVQQSPGQSDLPSWVPDWREQWHGKHLISAALKSFKQFDDTTAASFTATAGRYLKLHDEECSNQLSLYGKSFSRIKILADVVTNALEYGSTFSTGVAHLYEMGFPRSPKYPRTELTSAAVLYMTMMTFRSLVNQPENLTTKTCLDNVGLSEEKRGTSSVASSTRRLFLTENDYIGFAPANTAVGDEICLLFGGDVPYVVRERDDSHQFIGECYCYGIMNGEAVRTCTGKEDQDSKNEKLYVLA